MKIIQKINKVVEQEIANLRNPKKNPLGFKTWLKKNNKKAYRAVIRYATGY